MVQGDIDNDAVPSEEISGLAMDMEQIKLLFALEDVQPPVLIGRLPSFRGLVVLQNDTLESLRLGC
jgi:hypothetical protein